VVEEFLGEFRPDYWVSDRYGGQMGFAKKEQQICLAHLIRDAQYAIDAGDEIFAPDFRHLLGCACRIGRNRERLKDATLKTYEARMDKRLGALMARTPTCEAGVKLQRAIRKCRRHLFVFVTNRDIPATNNGSERALRPCAAARCFERSPTAFAPNGAQNFTPTSAPSSKQPADAPSAHTKPSASPSPGSRCSPRPEFAGVSNYRRPVRWAAFFFQHESKDSYELRLGGQ